MDRIAASDRADCLVIRLGGEIVMDVVPDVKSEIDRLAADSPKPHVVIDLAGVGFMDSSGIGFLIGLKKDFAAAGKDLCLQNPTPPIKKLLSMLRLTDYFGLLASETDLCAHTAN